MAKTNSDLQVRKGTNGILGILSLFIFTWRESSIEDEAKQILFFLSLPFVLLSCSSILLLSH
jgi:hypothetical protein